MWLDYIQQAEITVGQQVECILYSELKGEFQSTVSVTLKASKQLIRKIILLNYTADILGGPFSHVNSLR